LTNVLEELVSKMESRRDVHPRFLRSVHQHYGSVDCASDSDLRGSVSNFPVPSSAVGKSTIPFRSGLPNTNRIVPGKTGACIIALGYANFVIIPCANVFGRRPVMIACGAIALASDIWQATAKDYNSFIGARVLNGIGSASNESIMTIVVADIFFLHERGSYVGLYL
jgi:MFS family permease